MSENFNNKFEVIVKIQDIIDEELGINSQKTDAEYYDVTFKKYDLRNRVEQLANRLEAIVGQGRSLPDVACGSFDEFINKYLPTHIVFTTAVPKEIKESVETVINQMTADYFSKMKLDSKPSA